MPVLIEGGRCDAPLVRAAAVTLIAIAFYASSRVMNPRL
jgi:hypothetical protein